MKDFKTKNTIYLVNLILLIMSWYSYFEDFKYFNSILEPSLQDHKLALWAGDPQPSMH